MEMSVAAVTNVTGGIRDRGTMSLAEHDDPGPGGLCLEHIDPARHRSMVVHFPNGGAPEDWVERKVRITIEVVE